MSRTEALVGVPIQFGGSNQRETLDNMVSAARSADFEQLALPLLPSLYNHAFWLDVTRRDGGHLTLGGRTRV
jgi:hypothetical protein